MYSPLSSRAAGALVVLLAVGSIVRPASAQNVVAVVTGSSAPAAAPAPAPGPQERRILSDILADQKDIWTSPFRLDKGDAKWVIPALLITAALIGTDREVNRNITATPDSIRASDRVAHLGSGFATLGASGAIYLAGHITHNERARETGLLAAEAFVDQLIVVTGLKAATNRERPNKTNGQQDFYDGGSAFPSGHAAASWTFATVVAEQYHDKPLIRWGAYSIAAAVSIARVSGEKHSPSDVFVGGLIGYLIGRHVVKRGAATGNGTSFTIAPVVDAPTRMYGISGVLQF